MTGRLPSPSLFLAAAAGVLIFNLYPVFWLALGSLRGPEGLTAGHYRDVFSVFSHVEALKNTFVLALISIPAAVAAGVFTALCTTRVALPGAAWIRAGSVVAFVSPPWVAAMAYSYLLSPRAGLVNRWFFDAFGVRPFDVFTMAGMSFVMALYLYPYVYLVVSAALDNMDSSYEEAAITVGCSPLRTLTAVTLPLITPAVTTSVLYSVVFVWGMYAIPSMLGVPGKVYVFATYLWNLLNSNPPRLELASAMGMFFAVVSGGLFWAAFRLMRRQGERFQVVGGKGHRAVRLDLGRAAWLIAAANGAILALVLLVPYAMLVVMATSRSVYRPPSAANFTLRHFTDHLANPDFPRIVANTLQTAGQAAVVGCLIALIVAYLHQRSRAAWTDALAVAATFPVAVPGVVFVIGTAWAWLRPPIVLYGTLWVIAINQIARFLPLAVNNLRDGIGQVHASLEEAARTCGAGTVTTVVRIAAPLIRPTVVNTFLLLFMSSVRDLLSPLFLGDGSPRTINLGARIFFLWGEGLTAESAALCILLLALMLAVYLPVQRAFGRPPASRAAAAAPSLTRAPLAGAESQPA
jgi:iron(III) transport system permease protein